MLPLSFDVIFSKVRVWPASFDPLLSPRERRPFIDVVGVWLVVADGRSLFHVACDSKDGVCLIWLKGSGYW